MNMPPAPPSRPLFHTRVTRLDGTRENPMAVETIVPLLEMGVSGDEILELIDAALKKVCMVVYGVQWPLRPHWGAGGGAGG